MFTIAVKSPGSREFMLVHTLLQEQGMRILKLCMILALTACSHADERDSSWESEESDECPLPRAEQRQWVHSTQVHLTTGQGDAHHGAADIVLNPGNSGVATARFSYGPLFKDLEDEDISAWITSEACAWESLGVARTDDSGTARFTIPGAFTETLGRRDIRFEVNGDGTDVSSSVWVAEAGQPSVVFDLDGTLTPADTELSKNLLLGVQPAMYEAANEVAWAYAERGYQIIYMSGRPVYLDGRSRQWLADLDFPRGALKLPYDVSETLPHQSSVGAFKQRTLEDLQAERELFFRAAYGNATTDICAYAGAGISAQDTFIIGPHAGEACEEGDEGTQAVPSYPEHLIELLAWLPDAV